MQEALGCLLGLLLYVCWHKYVCACVCASLYISVWCVCVYVSHCVYLFSVHTSVCVCTCEHLCAGTLLGIFSQLLVACRAPATSPMSGHTQLTQGQNAVLHCCGWLRGPGGLELGTPRGKGSLRCTEGKSHPCLNLQFSISLSSGHP